MRQWRRCFTNGNRLAGERTLIKSQALIFDDTDVCGYDVACLYADDVPRGELGAWEEKPLLVSEHSAAGSDKLLEEANGFFGVIFLRKAQRDVDADKKNDHESIYDLAKSECESCSTGKKINEWGFKLP